jgi:hypothetical protein
MNNTQPLNRSLGTIGWGLIFVWWGVTEMIKFPSGTGAIGVGLILLGMNAVRLLNGIPGNGFSITIGILALVWGGLELAGSVLSLPFQLPVFAILLIVLGVSLLAPELLRTRNA